MITKTAFPESTGGRMVPTADIVHSFEEGDERGSWGIFTYHIEDEGQETEKLYYCEPSFTKYIDIDVALEAPGTYQTYSAKNVIVYRLADAMLLYAEAETEARKAPSADALAQINILRTRAGLEPAALPSSYEDMIDLVRHERRMELHAEGKRRHDLVRWGLLQEKTRNYDSWWQLSDNPVYMSDGTDMGSNMLESYQNMHLNQTIAFGCETTLEAPAYMALFPLSSVWFTYNPDWVQNVGF